MAARGGLGSLSVFLGLDTAEFNDGLSKAEQRAQQFADRAKAIAVGAAFGNIIADAAKQAARGLYDMTFGAINAADHLNDLSKKTGIAVDTLGGIGFAAGQAGGDLESATAAAGKLNKSLAEAAAGGKEAVEGFKVLGVSVKDATGQTRSADKVLADLADKFATYADGPEKAALALRIFGKAGAEIIPLLDDGGAALQANIEYFRRYSGVTQQVAEDSDTFNDTLGKVNLISGAFGTTLSATLLPSFQKIADEFLHMKETGDGFKGTAEAVKAAFDFLVIAAANVAFVFLGVGREIGAVAAQLNALAHGDLDGFTAIGDAVKEDGKRARAELDKFVAEYANAGKKANAAVDPADFAVLDQLAKAKRAAPRLGAETKAPKAFTDLTYDQEITKRAANAIAGSDVQKAKDFAETLQRLDDLFFNAGLDASIYDSAVKNLSKSTSTADAQANQFFEDQKRLAELLNGTAGAEIERQRKDMLLLADAYESGTINLETYLDAVSARLGTANATQTDDAKKLAEQIQGFGADAFGDFLTGAKTAGEAFKSFANSVINDILRIQAKKLAESVFGSSGAGGLADILKLFGGGAYSGSSSNASAPNYVNSLDAGFPLATGTDYVPYDGFKATLHKGEAVVPAKYNDAAGGRSRAAAPSVVFEDHAGVQMTATTEDDGTLRLVVEAASDAAYARGAADLSSGTGQYSQALRTRHGVGPGTFKKRR